MTREPGSSLVVGLEGPWPTEFEAAWLRQYQPAGVILFSRNVIDFQQLRRICHVLRQLVPDLEIMADHEGGPVSQLAAAVGRPPSAWSLGDLDDTGLTARVFSETGGRLVAAGIDRVLAPVADVLTEVRNPVIGVRSFGGDPSLVSRHTVAAVTGLIGTGLKVCLKHWPGHGGSSVDSHQGETAARNGAVPAPFEAGLTAGADALMVGHLLVDETREGTIQLPATLDSDFLAASRLGLGPGRVEDLDLFADDVTMGALGPAMARLGVAVPEVQATGLFDPATLPRAWFDRLTEAGCDRLLIRGVPSAAFPLDRQDGPEPGGPGEPGVEEDESPAFQGGPYEEARRRSWAVGAAGFADRSADLLWLDYSRGDRWEVAADQDGTTPDVLRNILEGMFRSVVDGSEGIPDGKSWGRLLVSSHRPLPKPGKKPTSLSGGGTCLTLGHPSLAADLADWLGPGWQVGALFDVAPEDLSAGARAPEQ